jgi:hypothetical protein
VQPVAGSEPYELLLRVTGDDEPDAMHAFGRRHRHDLVVGCEPLDGEVHEPVDRIVERLGRHDALGQPDDLVFRSPRPGPHAKFHDHPPSTPPASDREPFT